MPARPKIGARIRRGRQLLDMRQQDLADKLGVSRTTVDAWENDRSWPQRKLARLEQALGITLVEDGEDEGDPEELVPEDGWEAEVLSDPDLPDRIKRRFILDSRAARGAYPARSGRHAAPARGRESGRDQPAV